MASIAGLDLELDQPRFYSGAAYHLSHPSREDFRWTDCDSTEVVLRAGIPYAAVTVPSILIDPDRIMAHTYDAAQRALDIVSVLGVDDLAMPDAHEGELLWWRDDSGVTLRAHTFASGTIGMKATIKIKGPDGVEAPQPPTPSLPWQRAFRYYRLAQTTGDLYDAYRNTYLAFESLLSDLHPPRIVGPNGQLEHERDWLKRTFHTYEPYLRGTIPPGTADPFKYFYDLVYRAQRCAMFHARRAADSILPRSFDSRRDVELALEQLAHVVGQLFTAHASARQQGGIITYAGFELLMQGLSSNPQVVVTDSLEHEATDPAHGNVIFTELSSPLMVASLPARFERSFLSMCPTSALQSLTVNTIVGRRADTGDIFAMAAIDTLRLDGVDTLQVMQTYALRSRGLPRTRFQF